MALLQRVDEERGDPTGPQREAVRTYCSLSYPSSARSVRRRRGVPTESAPGIRYLLP